MNHKLIKYYQSLPLEFKVYKTIDNIREFVREYGVDDCYVSFSGGKDSTVLLDIARQIYPNIEAVFVNTGLEYPEIQRFVKTFDNVRIVYPKHTFREVTFRPRQGGTNSINIKKIVKIGWKALGDFRRLKKAM